MCLYWGQLKTFFVILTYPRHDWLPCHIHLLPSTYPVGRKLSWVFQGIPLPSHTFQLLAASVWSTEQLDMPRSLKESIPEASQSGTWIALASSFWHVGAAALLYNFYPYVWVNLVSLSELSEADYWNFKTEVSQIHLEKLLYKSFGTGQNITRPISILWGQGHLVYQSNFS